MKKGSLFDRNKRESVLAKITVTMMKEKEESCASNKLKLCFATLARETQRDPESVGAIIRQVLPNSSQQDTKMFFEAGLLCDIQSVKAGIDLYN